MKRRLLIFSVSFLLTFSLAYSFLLSSKREIIPGAVSIELPGRCEIIQIAQGLQPEFTIVIACPRMDMMRLWPLPVIQPWFEDFDPCGQWGKCENCINSQYAKLEIVCLVM